MKNNYSINEIASALGLSRNTVSKVINHKSGVSQKTTNLVNHFLADNPSNVSSQPAALVKPSTKYIVFTCHYENTEYFNEVLTNIQESLKENGYELVANIIRDNTLQQNTIPQILMDGSACGVISFNIFDKYYWDRIIELNIPAVFIDTFHDDFSYFGKTDIITAEGNASLKTILQQLLGQGMKTFGYVGDPVYSYSINQRWQTLKNTLAESNYPLDPKYCFYDYECLIGEESMTKNLENCLRSMEKLPDVFICGNDLYAILVLQIAKNMGYRVPEDISIVGFDNTSETLRQQPLLTTIDAHPNYVGKTSVQLLLDRLKNPSTPHKLVLTQSDIVLRQTTKL